LALGYVMQVHGFDISPWVQNSSMMVDNVLRARVTPGAAAIGFVPGILATLLGTGISGIGIYQRQTSQLFKELEA
jgi:putative ABC transport system permease protein